MRAFGRLAAALTTLLAVAAIVPAQIALLVPHALGPASRPVTTAPTLTVGSSATITAQVVNVASSATTIDGRFRIVGGRYEILSGPKIQTAPPTLGTPQSEPIAVEFESDAPALEAFHYNALGNMRIVIDGAAFQSVGGKSLFRDVGAGYFKLVFGSGAEADRKWRKYRIEGNIYQLISIAVDAGSTIRRPMTPPGPHVVFLTDSYGYTQSGNTNSPATTYDAGVGGTAGALGGSSIESPPWECARILGWGDSRLVSRGGTGLTNNGGTIGGDFYSRFKADVMDRRDLYDALVIFGSINDTGLALSTPSALRGAAYDLIMAARVYRPNAPIVWVGPSPTASAVWPATSPNLIAQDALLQGLCASLSVPYVSGVQGKAWDANGNLVLNMGAPWVSNATASATLIGTDNVHPTPQGAQALGGFWAQGIAAALNLPYTCLPTSYGYLL